MKKDKVSIILLNWNGKKDTLECLASLQKLTYPNYEILIVDNGSSDDSIASFQKEFPSLPIIQTFSNLGYAGGNNVGVDHALERGADYILLLNNDTIVSSDLLDRFLDAAKKQPKGGLFGGKILSYKEPKLIDHLGGNWNPRIGEFVSIGKGKDITFFTDMQKVDYVSGCALFIKREVIEKVGKLDPRFFLLWEETDFCYRARTAGFEIWSVPTALVWHKISASFSGKALMHYYWWRNRLLWIEKNLPWKEKKQLYFQVILKDIFKIYKHFALKSLQYFFLKLFSPSQLNERKKAALKRYRAGCLGIRHYFLRKFGGPITIK